MVSPHARPPRAALAILALRLRHNSRSRACCPAPAPIGLRSVTSSIRQRLFFKDPPLAGRSTQEQGADRTSPRRADSRQDRAKAAGSRSAGSRRPRHAWLPQSARAGVGQRVAHRVRGECVEGRPKSLCANDLRDGKARDSCWAMRCRSPVPRFSTGASHRGPTTPVLTRSSRIRSPGAYRLPSRFRPWTVSLL
jgi:hypothetical protein